MPTTKLSVILRLAVILHRGRSDTPLPAFTLKLSNKASLELCLDDTWLQQHPLTQEDLEQEKCFLADAGFELRLCRDAQS